MKKPKPESMKLQTGCILSKTDLRRMISFCDLALDAIDFQGVSLFTDKKGDVWLMELQSEKDAKK